ncbi:hypothetical protein CK203_055600 [Vitis vinifera]|uniref:Reverse transcriptase zinc-binding domain-containing protein n=1 Tax=Vitis vinifera TaxID=29760 RepID=A0A438FV56_VITVI|nr:hypothetical protein CK203_055600 [Vitis vinifera]
MFVQLREKGLRFSRHLNDWEIKDMECFFARLVSKGVDVGEEDKVPPKVTFFTWEVAWGKALILDLS